MKYIKSINEEVSMGSTIGNIIKKKFGNYESPIWIHIKIFDNGEKISCFIENDWVGINDTNKYLMEKLNKKFKLNLNFSGSVNNIDFDKIEPICDFFEKLGLEVVRHEQNKGTSIITIKGTMSENDIKHKLRETLN